MHVGVHRDLPSRGPAIPPDVVPVGVKTLVHPRPDVCEQREGRVDLVARQVENGFRVPDRNDDARAEERALFLHVLQEEHRRTAQNDLLIRMFVQMTQATLASHASSSARPSSARKAISRRARRSCPGC